MSSFTLRAVALAATSMGLVLVAPSANAVKKLSDWGFICKGGESTDARNECCTSKQTDCVAECNDNYQGASRDTCLGLCRQKGDACRGEVNEIRVSPQGGLKAVQKPKQPEKVQ